MHECCLLCKSGKLELLSRYAVHHLVKCNTCGFVFANQIPSESLLIHHYEGYGRKNYLSPITVKRYHELLEGFEKFRKTQQLIDVGCGMGYFLEAAREKNWKVYGTEFTDEAVRICKEKGIMVHQGKLNPDNYEASSFDVITSFEVMEHINNPKQEVKHFHTLLRKRGVVYVTTPNFNSLSRWVLKEKWNVLAYPEHLCYYSSSTLNKLFADEGFSLLKMETTGVSITRARTSLKLSTQSFISESSDDEKLRRMLESNLFLKGIKGAANKALTMLNAGDSIKATFIKN